jgi:valyl-tRNA synthetase
MSIELEKTYDFKSTEQRLYSWWESKGYFSPVNDPRKPGFDRSKKSFTISIPPPNVTGELHLGHAMGVAMEDLMIRYNRMKGNSTLWVPGMDHASIATQLQVEKMLLAEGIHREQLGREEFIKRTWEWKEKYGGIIVKQIRRLGASCDWTRERFTMDEGLSKAVREAFVQLYDKGLIYHGKRLINWAPLLKTAVSELEVEYSEEPGFLYYFKYMLADGSGEFIPVATTRPETILGDSAIAVHPEDDRYKIYIGKKVLVPILGRAIPVIADKYVAQEFGTGALKITPAHDPNDYQIGQRHSLEFISIMDNTAHINENGGPYTGLDRFAARKKLWEDMKIAGLVLKEMPYTLNIPRSQRGGEIVEPMLSTQWFLRIKPLADEALKVVREGQIRIVPEHFTKVYFNWLENIQDWCISRQLWWGHRIPVWYCDDCGKEFSSREDPTECPQCHSKNIRQDPDVLDTWFSSGLWPFSTLGWPEETPDLKYFFPTSIMETGYDILFFWVARMIMFSLEFTHKIPFETVYLHGLVRDEEGHKLSKSKGYAMDPLIIMDEMGTDALRFTLLVGSTPGNDTNLNMKKVEANRNFANKIWNAGRFVINAIQNAPSDPGKKSIETLADRWILTRLNQLIRSVDRLFSNFQYGEAGRQIYDFLWSEFADWYLEIAKLQLTESNIRAFQTAKILAHVFDTSLRLLHPFTPFVTEELWGYLKKSASEKGFTPLGVSKPWEEALIIAAWPEAGEAQSAEDETVQDFGFLMDIIREIRNMRVEKKVTPGKKIQAIFVSAERFEFLKSQKTILCALAHLDTDSITFKSNLDKKPEKVVSLIVSGVEIHLPLAGMLDLEAENSRLEKELKEAEFQVERLEKLLSSDFGSKAPSALVDKENQKLMAYKETIVKLKAQMR